MSGDERYYARFLNWRAIYELQHAPRREMVAHFMKELSPTEKDSVLDLGATSLPDPGENIFELLYPWPSRVVAAGTEDCSFLEKTYPGLKFTRVDSGKPLPFADNTFDIGYAGAVIEHAGSRERQAFFLSELIRVTRRCYLTTPNRWYPVELHTRLPLLHWLPNTAFRGILNLLGFDFYAKEENLNLLTAGELLALLPKGLKRVDLSRQFFLGLPSNLRLVVEK